MQVFISDEGKGTCLRRQRSVGSGERPGKFRLLSMKMFHFDAFVCNAKRKLGLSL